MFSSITPETGWLDQTYPYVRIGNGPKTLLVIPGLGDAMFDGEYGSTGAVLAWRGFGHFMDEYTVYVVSRPRGLSDDQTIETMARDYARVLETHVGSASVLGISMGGLIAQELARIRPDLLERLVVAVSGCRLGEQSADGPGDARARTRRRVDRYPVSAPRGDVHGCTSPTLPCVLTNAWPPPVARTRYPSDVVVSIDAVLAYDGSDRLAEIDPRTLVIGADDDPFFPEEILRETHAGLPDAQLAMFRGPNTASRAKVRVRQLDEAVPRGEETQVRQHPR
ncbi:alpha/beta hydrolase [Natrialba swarupiae]|nr:alpha/beta hydrolase [Natrialba swarupiae]